MYLGYAQYKQKGITQVYLLIVLLIVGGLGGYYYFNKTSNKPVVSQPIPSITPTKAADETVNWKTYQFSKPKDYKLGQYAFSIKYPSDWILKELSLNSQEISTKIHITSPGKSYVDLNIGPSNNISASTVFRTQVDNMKMYIDNPKEETLKIADFDQSIKLSGTLKPTATPEGIQYNFQIILLKKGELIYSLSLNQYPQENYAKIFDQILSTFKFTN